MLTIEFVNDGKGTDLSANYDVRVLVNGRVIDTEHVTGHLRSQPWDALVMRLIRKVDERNWLDR